MAIFSCSSCFVMYEDYYPPDDTCILCKQGLIRIVTTNQQQKETTMLAITSALQLFTREEDNSGIHFTSLIMKHRGNAFHLHATTTDSIHVFTESIALYILTINKVNGTLGLAAYMAPEPHPINSYYIHTPQHIRDIFGPEWEQLSPETIVLKLINYLM